MPNYRRLFVPSATYFFTVVTYRRRPVFADLEEQNHLRETIREVREIWPFTVIGFILLPDHLHTIWVMPEGDCDFATRWKLIKSIFTRTYFKRTIESYPPSPSRLRKRERTIWQRRYWEHLIRDENDLQKHLEYIHYNPVKHGHANRAGDWEMSTFHHYVKLGWYDPAWGDKEPTNLLNNCVGE